MTYLKYSTILFIFSLLLTSCKPDTQQVKKLVASESVEVKTIPSDSVFLSLENTTFSTKDLPKKLSVTLYNTTNDTITAGRDYTLGRYTDSSWVDITPFLFFDSLGYEIYPGGSYTFEHALHQDSIAYTRGIYRIQKSYLKPDFINTREHFYTWVTFVVE